MYNFEQITGKLNQFIMGVHFTDFGAFRAPYLLHLPYLYHLIRHALAVGFYIGTYTYIPPQCSDAGCERLYLPGTLMVTWDILYPVQHLTLRRKAVIFSLQIFFVSQQFIKRCDLPFPQKVTLLPIAVEFDKILPQQVVAASAHFPAVCFSQQCTVMIVAGHKAGDFAAFCGKVTTVSARRWRISRYDIRTRKRMSGWID